MDRTQTDVGRPARRPRATATVGALTVTLAATLALGLAACAPTSARPEPGAAAPRVHAGEPRLVASGSMTATDVAAAHTAFGVDLLHRLCQADPGGNVLVSPTSAALALGLLQPGASGPAAHDLAALLHLPAWSPDLLAATRDHTASLKALHHDGDLDADDAPDSLRISNRVWTATSGPGPEQRYLDDVVTAFDAGVQSVDFLRDAPGATDAVNRAVAQDTAGMIESLFDQPLSPATAVVLTNAVHLRARWRTPFTHTDPDVFRAPSGAVTVPMMAGGSGAARTADGWTAVDLPYRDGTLTAVAVLPPSGDDPCSVEAADLAVLAAAEPQDADVSMPRLSIEQTHALLPELEALGLRTHGDYSALCGGCHISDVVQKTVLEVDETGTEAAAATGVVMETSMPLPAPVTVTVDRPYLLLLTDTATRSPLFLAVVHDPTA